MSDKSRIEWTDATWNPVTGCTKVSDGCKHCYAERTWARLSAPRAVPNRYTGRKFTDVQCHMDVLTQPLRWQKPRRIFVNSMSDLFHDAVPDTFIDQVFAVMAACRQHTFQVLTKRPARMLDYLTSYQVRQTTTGIVVPEAIMTWLKGRTNMPELQWPLPNVWLGVSVEDQATADERIPLLRQTPAAVRWVSCEPLLGPVDFYRISRGGTGPEGNIDWVVAGGESGPKARPMHPDWVRSLRDQCAAADVPFLFKQWGEWAPIPATSKWLTTQAIRVKQTGETLAWPPMFDPACGDRCMFRAGKKATGRLLDGVEHDDYPEVRP